MYVPQTPQITLEPTGYVNRQINCAISHLYVNGQDTGVQVNGNLLHTCVQHEEFYILFIWDIVNITTYDVCDADITHIYLIDIYQKKILTYQPIQMVSTFLPHMKIKNNKTLLFTSPCNPKEILQIDFQNTQTQARLLITLPTKQITLPYPKVIMSWLIFTFVIPILFIFLYKCNHYNLFMTIALVIFFLGIIASFCLLLFLLTHGIITTYVEFYEWVRKKYSKYANINK